MEDIIVDPNSKKDIYSMPKSNFISSYKVARDIVDQACVSHNDYWEILKVCNEHIAGAKPIPQVELEKKGLGWSWNFNYNKASAKMEKMTAESIATVSTALALGYVTFRNQEDDDEQFFAFLKDEGLRGMVASIIGYALMSTLARETRLSGWLNQIEYISIGMGYCPLVFSKYDWIPEPINPMMIAFKPNTKADTINTWVTFKTVEATELFDRWVDAKNSEGEVSRDGWVLGALEDLLCQAFKGRLQSKDGRDVVVTKWADVIPFYSENSSQIIMDTESVNIAKISHRELDGTFSEVIIPYDNRWDSDGKPKELAGTASRNNIIFRKNLGAYKQSEQIALIRDSGFSTENGTIQSLRGVLKFAVEDGIRYNRYRNGLGNKMTFVGSPMFESNSSQSAKKLKLTVSQGFVILPDSHRMLEKQPSFDIGSHINVLRFEEGEYLRDTQQYDASIQGRLTSRPNKGEVQAVAGEVEFTKSAKSSVKFRDYAAVFFAVIKKIASCKPKDTDPGFNGKKTFYAIIKKQMPTLIKNDSDIDKILRCIDGFTLETVTTNIDTITIAIQMAETPFARNRLKRMLMVAKGMPIEEINLSIPLITDKFANLNDDRVAAFENDMFFTTNEVILSGTDDDMVHLESHISKCERMIQGSQQGAISPVDAFKYLENNLGHSVGHLEKLGNDPILHKKIEEYIPRFKMISKEKELMKEAAAKILQQQQEQSQQVPVDPQIQAKIRDENMKVQSDIQRKDYLHQARTEQKAKQIDLSHEERLRQIELKHQEQLIKLSQQTPTP